MIDENGWEELRLSPGGHDDTWEMFHENSKVGRHDRFPPQSFILERMDKVWQSLPYRSHPSVALPSPKREFKLTLSEAITTRVSGRKMERVPLTLQTISTILYHAYGITRLNEDNGFPRPYRTVPSGGALYPLEIYLHSNHCREIQTGLYQYNPVESQLKFLREGDATREISKTLIQPNIASECSLMIFISALFERSIFKYGARGYRFALLEAGHVAQNINLVTNGIGLGCLNVGGYRDRELDEFLGFDGIRQSTVYVIGIGKLAGDEVNVFVEG
jgi:SagB-type dehydrogenase family enzyme